MPSNEVNRTDLRHGAGVEVKVFAEVDGTRIAVTTGRVGSEHWTEEDEDGIAYVESGNYDDLAKAIENITKTQLLAEVRRRIGQRKIRDLEDAAEEAVKALEAAREEELVPDG